MWPRSRRWFARICSRVALGIALIFVPALVAIDQLRVGAPARQEPSSVAVIPFPYPTRDAGVAVGMLVEVKGCGSDVDVTVVAEPTAEYWLANRNARLVRFALPDAVDGDVRFHLGDSASDVTTPQDVVDRGQRGAATDPATIRVIDKRSEGQKRDLLVATLEVPHWNRTLRPVIASYSAQWLENRGLGSCWLRLPALTGDLTVLAAKRALDQAYPIGPNLPSNPGDLRVASRRANAQAVYTAGFEAIHGSITVVSPEAEIGDSLPSPPGSTNGSPTWTCRAQPKAKARPLRSSFRSHAPSVISGTVAGPSAGAFSAKVISSAKSGDCSAVAAVIESSAGWQRDLFMLVVGTLVGLGFTLLVDLLKRSPSADTTEGGA
jgi:hypothetical protein